MSFLSGLLKSVQAPPEKNPMTLARDKAQKEALRKKQKQEEKKRENDEVKAWDMVKEFKGSDENLFKFPVMTSDERAVVHEVCSQNSIPSHAFGVEEEDRRVIAFKSGFEPSEEDLLLMDRSLNYEDCLADLKARKATIEAKRKANELASEKPTNASRSTVQKFQPSAKAQRLLGALDATPKAPEQGEYGEVPRHLSHHAKRNTEKRPSSELSEKGKGSEPKRQKK
eukprot:m.118705 g.118705  ORF g.118705 m.118705 type:complete len:226 (-) comp14286_c0_seq2:53-730(-)